LGNCQKNAELEGTDAKKKPLAGEVKGKENKKMRRS